MNESDLLDLISVGETRGIEFKSPCSRGKNWMTACVVRSMLGMSNKRDGGWVFLGVREDRTNRVFQPVGLSVSERSTWNFDDLAKTVADHADPHVVFQIHLLQIKGSLEVIGIQVMEFETMPVICKRQWDVKPPGETKPKPILKRGALYVRSHGKPETIEVSSEMEMRQVIELASDKELRKLAQRVSNAGLVSWAPSSVADDDQKFRDQAKDLL